MKVRKKPVEVEAWPIRQLLAQAANAWSDLPQSVRGEYEKGNIIFADESMSIKTLEGDHRGDIDDMLIKGVKGEFYPCKPDIFEQTYERI